LTTPLSSVTHATETKEWVSPGAGNGDDLAFRRAKERSRRGSLLMTQRGSAMAVAADAGGGAGEIDAAADGFAASVTQGVGRGGAAHAESATSANGMRCIFTRDALIDRDLSGMTISVARRTTNEEASLSREEHGDPRGGTRIARRALMTSTHSLFFDASRLSRTAASPTRSSRHTSGVIHRSLRGAAALLVVACASAPLLGCSSDGVDAAAIGDASTVGDATADAGAGPEASVGDAALLPVTNGISVVIDGEPLLLDTVTRASFVVSDASYPGSTLLSATRGTGSAKRSMHLELHGKAPGTYPCVAGGRNHVIYTGDGVYIASGSNLDGGVLGACSIVVTAYGDVGGIIEGTLTATLPKSVGSATDPDERIIQHGAFRFVREADQ
jgi:hypothetical protein